MESSLNKLPYLRNFILGICLTAAPLAFGAAMPALDFSLAAECSFSESEMRASLGRFFDQPDSNGLSALRKYYPELTEKDLNKLRISIQDFGSEKKFRGFFETTTGQIYLDCARGSFLSWDSLLAHEIAHSQNAKKDLAPWMDEMLAQLVELRSTPFFTFPSFDLIRGFKILPSFFPNEKPFLANSSYGTNLLFALYIYRNFQGTDAFLALKNKIKTLEDFAIALKDFTQGKGQFDWIREHLTAENLIRYYALAANINTPTRNGGSLYLIPGWRGFLPDALLREPGIYQIAPGGFMRIHSSFAGSLTNYKELCIYRILKRDKEFKIQKIEEPVEGEWTENFLLLINTSTTQSLEIRI